MVAYRLVKIERSRAGKPGARKPWGNYRAVIKGPLGHNVTELGTKDAIEAQQKAEAMVQHLANFQRVVSAPESAAPAAPPAVAMPAAAAPSGSSAPVQYIPPPPAPANRVAAAFARFAPAAPQLSPQGTAPTVGGAPAAAFTGSVAAGPLALTPEQLEMRRRRIAKTFAKGASLVLIGITAWTCKQFDRQPDAPAEDEEELLEESLETIMDNAIRNPHTSPWWMLAIAVPVMGAGMYRDGKPMVKKIEGKVLQLHEGGKKPDEKEGDEHKEEPTT